MIELSDIALSAFLFTCALWFAVMAVMVRVYNPVFVLAFKIYPAALAVSCLVVSVILFIRATT